MEESKIYSEKNHGLKPVLLLFLPFFLGGKRKRVRNNQLYVVQTGF